jgi:ADP-ribose pyrophosphatase YjhB (NUDIX family)
MAHIHELIDFTITAYIVHHDSVLLVNHPRYQKWLPIGGHIELDEDPETALHREIKEESGLETTILSTKPDNMSAGHEFVLTPNYVDIHDANPPHRHVSFVYFALAHTDAFVKSDEHDDMRWITISELHNPEYDLSPEVIFYCESAVALAQQ